MLAWFPEPFDLIVANGDIPAPSWLSAYLARASLVVAADGGARHIIAAGGQPDVIVGDLDSLPAPMRAELAAKGTTYVTHPVNKDATDLALALAWVIDHSDKAVVIAGAFGGRWDQSLANVLLLTQAPFLSRPVSVVGAFQRAWVVTGRATIAGAIGDRLSLVPLTEGVRVTTLTGLHWRLRGELLPVGSSRGISNEMTANTAELTVAGGLVLLVQTAQEWHR